MGPLVPPSRGLRGVGLLPSTLPIRSVGTETLLRIDGKSGHAHAQAVADVQRGDVGQVWATLDDEMRRALQDGRYKAVVLDNVRWFPLPDYGAAMKHFQSGDKVTQSDTAFFPRTG